MKWLFILTLSPVFATIDSQSPEPVQPVAPFKFEIVHVESSKPQIIYIFNLEEGTRKMVLPPSFSVLEKSTKPEAKGVEPSQSQTIRILNLGEGTNEIVLPPAP